METLVLKGEKVAINTLENYSVALKERLTVIESELLRIYEGDYAHSWAGISEHYVELRKMEFLESLVYEKIEYPKDHPIMLSNDRNGGFEYLYDRTLLKEYSLNARINSEVRFHGSPALYLVDKVNPLEESFLFFYEKTLSDEGQKNKVIIVAC